MNIFRNKKFEVKMLPDTNEHGIQYVPVGDVAAAEIDKIDHVAEVANEFVMKTAVTVGLVYTGVHFAKTLFRVVEIAAESKLFR